MKRSLMALGTLATAFAQLRGFQVDWPDAETPRSLQSYGNMDNDGILVETADRVDAILQAHKPKSMAGWWFTMMLPGLGASMFIMAFPVLWFNEQRAFGRRPAAQTTTTQTVQTVQTFQAVPTQPAASAGSPPVQAEIVSYDGPADKPVVPASAPAPAPDQHHAAPTSTVSTVTTTTSTTAAAERQSFLAGTVADRTYSATADMFEDRLGCHFWPCQFVHRMYDKLPVVQAGGYQDAQVWAFRLIGLTMMFVGLDLFLYPVYFVLHCVWFLGFIFAGHLAICVCKSTCCAWVSTIVTSYTIHRPFIIGLLCAIFLACVAATVYYTSQRAPQGH